MNTVIAFEREKFFSRLIWIFPIVYVFHITEESNGFTDWVNNVAGGHMTLKPFLVNNACFMVVNIFVCWLAMRKQRQWSTFTLFLWMSAQEFWNFISHIYAEFRFDHYSPGYFTAIFLYFPVFLYMTYVALREKFLTWSLWLIAFAFGPLALGITIWGGLYHFAPFPWSKWF